MYKFLGEKINVQQVSRTNIDAQQALRKKSTRNKFHEQNQFHVEKNQCANFMKRKISMQQVSRTKISFARRKKNQRIGLTKSKNIMQQLSRTKISTQQVSRTKSIGKKLHEQN